MKLDRDNQAPESYAMRHLGNDVTHRALVALPALLLALILAWANSVVAFAAAPDYVVQSGDTLTGIAMTVGTTAEEVALLNNLPDPNYIYVGQTLQLPSISQPDSGGSLESENGGDQACEPVLHFVAAGETLSGISMQYGVSTAQIAAVNGIANPSLISVGQALSIPGAACAQPLVLGPAFQSIAWVPEQPRQGDTVKLTVVTHEPLADLSGSFGDLPIHFVSEGNSHTAYLGIPAMAEPGFREVRLSLEGEPSQVLAIPVMAGSFIEERLILTPETTQLLAPDVVQHENDLLASVTARFTQEFYWDGSLAFPFAATRPVISAFGTRRAYNDGPVSSFHGGTDYPAQMGDPILAGAPGRVALAEPLDVRGNAVILDHGGGVFTFYCHLSEILVQPGDWVAAGEVVGLAGSTGLSTGPHLHWEMRVQGVRVDANRLVGTATG